MRNRSSLIIGCLAVLVLGVAGCSGIGPAQPPASTAQFAGTGIPAFQRHAPLARKEAPALRFVDWHPQQREMLVLARSQGLMQLHRLAAPGAVPEPLTQGADPVAEALWEPQQARYLVFTRDQGGDEAYRLHRLDAGKQPAPGQVLTPAGVRVKEFAFLPQGRGLVFLQEQLDRKGGDEATATRQARSWLMWMDPQNPAGARVLGEVTGGRFGDLRITPEGTILVLRSQGQRSQLLSFDLSGAAGRPIGRAQSGTDDGEASDAERDGDVVWGRQALQGEFRHLTRLSAATGERQALLTGLSADLEALAVPPAAAGRSRPLALVSNEGGVSALRLYAPDSAAPPQRVATDLPEGQLRNARWHQQLPELGFHHVWTQSPGQVYSWNQADGKLTAWSAADTEGTALQTGLLRWKSFDGLEISGLHTPPPAHFKGPRPVYISLHGGPAAQARPGYLSATLRALVEQQGMHLIQPNVRGSDGFGKRFLALDNGRLRENATRDVSALLDLIATRADMDAGKVVVAGGSYGGYLTLAVAAAESPRIAGSICRVGIANFVSFLEHTESYRRDNRRAEYGDERDPAMRRFLTEISPLSRVDRMRKPMFIVHGRNDPRVPYGEAQQIVSALRAQGTPVWFLTAEDEGHSFTKPANRDELHQNTLEFVRRVVQGEPILR
jgi:dipeptidyl aminopeptidase/acylaminoacyl peptidase